MASFVLSLEQFVKDKNCFCTGVRSAAHTKIKQKCDFKQGRKSVEFFFFTLPKSLYCLMFLLCYGMCR